MFDHTELEKELRDLIVDLCEVLYQRGYRTVPVGAVMRLIGVSAENAAKHDNDMFNLDRDFEQLIKGKKQAEAPKLKSPPRGATIH